ncbi:MAG TPA: hypothetical protein VFO05_08565 [Candidatus Limnocylindrales bacterium]|nr:hypothetical protein [Candidatus Limnocylindrales bacterium]
MTGNRSLRLILAGGLVALVAACGGASSGEGSGSGADTGPTSAEITPRPTDIPFAEADATPGTALNACEILTADDIATATSTEDVPDGTLEAAPTVLDEGRTECTYEGDFGRIIVELTPTDGANLYDAAIGAYDGAELYDGIGDGGFWSEENHRAFFWKGSVTVMLTIFLSDADPTTTAEQLGTLAIGKV